MRMFLPVTLAATVFASTAMAGDAAKPLAPGKPAGVSQAQAQGVNPIVYLGLVGIAGVVAIAAGHSSHHGGGTTTTTTTTTGTSP